MIPHERGILVAAGLIWRSDSRVLITRRPPGSHLAGLWELPGGKLEPGETPGEALVREIREELDLAIEAGPRFAETTYDYPEKRVTLIAMHARILSGEPQTVGVADFRWVLPGEISEYHFPEADRLLFTGDWSHPPEGFVNDSS